MKNRLIKPHFPRWTFASTCIIAMQYVLSLNFFDAESHHGAYRRDQRKLTPAMFGAQ